MDPVLLNKIRSKINFKLIFAVIFILFTLGSFVKVVTSKPFLEPNDLKITNITESSVSISWTTSVEANERLIFWEGDKFVFIPFGITEYIDDKMDIQPTGKMLTHYITLNGLEANKNYKFRIYSGLINVYDGEFSTVGQIENLMPHPLYGKVVDGSGNPVVGALVYFQIRTGVDYSGVLSTFTDLQGGWSIDLNRLRDASLQNRFEPNNLSEEILLINTGRDHKISKSTIDVDEPWPKVVIQ